MKLLSAIVRLLLPVCSQPPAVSGQPGPPLIKPLTTSKRENSLDRNLPSFRYGTLLFSSLLTEIANLAVTIEVSHVSIIIALHVRFFY